MLGLSKRKSHSENHFLIPNFPLIFFISGGTQDGDEMYEFRNYSGVKIENEIILEVLLTIRDKMGIGLLSNYGKFLLSDDKIDEVCPRHESIDPECLSKMEIPRWFPQKPERYGGVF